MFNVFAYNAYDSQGEVTKIVTFLVVVYFGVKYSVKCLPLPINIVIFTSFS